MVTRMPVGYPTLTPEGEHYCAHRPPIPDRKPRQSGSRQNAHEEALLELGGL